MYNEILETNIINTAAIGISIADVNGLLTAIVLVTAAVYNIKKIGNETKD